MYTIDHLIDRRKKKWETYKCIKKDREYIETVAQYVVDNPSVLTDCKPEQFIELFFYIVDKEKKSVPFFLNTLQRKFVDELNECIEAYKKGEALDIKILILKGRQGGFTSFITSYQLADTIMRKNFEGFTCADEEGNTRAIFENKAKYPYSLLPDVLKPSEKYNNAKQLLFDKLHSSWEIKTASKNMGRSRTINFWHGSEAAFWRDGISGTQAAIGEALTKDAIVILETTANGFNEYKDLWDSNTYTNCFYEWWHTEEYSFNFENENKKQEFINNINSNKSEWIFERCRWLRDTIGLSLNQIYWYYHKYLNYIDGELIKQEYPCSADEAFLSSGKCIFDTEKLIQRKEILKAKYKKNPPVRGNFEIDWNYATNEEGKLVKTTIKSYKFVEDVNGYIEIYKKPEHGHPYCLGGDTSGEGSDWFIGDVMSNVNGEQVAQLRHQFDEDLYAEQMYCLGRYYNEALIGIEVNYSTYPTKKIANMIYPRMYLRETEDKITGDIKKSYGVETNKRTRPIIIAEAVKIVRDSVFRINSIQTINEMLSFIKNDKGRAEADVGKHDDCVMSFGITDYISSQQSTVIQIDIDDDEDDEDDKSYSSSSFWD